MCRGYVVEVTDWDTGWLTGEYLYAYDYNNLTYQLRPIVTLKSTVKTTGSTVTEDGIVTWNI